MREKAILQYKKTLDLLTQQDVIREDGYYFAKLHGIWRAAEYYNSYWYFTGVVVNFDESEIEEIGPKIEMPS